MTEPADARGGSKSPLRGVAGLPPADTSGPARHRSVLNNVWWLLEVLRGTTGASAEGDEDIRGTSCRALAARGSTSYGPRRLRPMVWPSPASTASMISASCRCGYGLMLSTFGGCASPTV